MSDILEKRIRVFGIVQGVGFRPTVDRLAHEAGITGTVANKGAFVEIFAEGTSDEISAFLHLLRTKAPERSEVLKIEVEDAESLREKVPDYAEVMKFDGCERALPNDAASRKYDDFKIIESEKVRADIFISPDIAICDQCKAELFDKSNRRYLHPFINCNECGPRFSILKALPYDRERTSMSEFPMCKDCETEYYSPASRRYDAQPVCCNKCGPEVYIIETDSTLDFVQQENVSKGGAGFSDADQKTNKHNCDLENSRDIQKFNIRDGAAITFARKVICSGGIVAIKGIGGFHLACDATNDEAVKRLRALKHRPMKPFAVMAKNESVADRECIISENQRKEMNGHRKPIILMEKKKGGFVAVSVAPENPYVGLMLPYAPVQMLIFDYPDEWQKKMPDVLVMTSGNISGAPIASNDEEAVTELSKMCDAILSNNREIRIRTDDSVMDFYEDEPYMIRRSRGIAPLPVILDSQITTEIEMHATTSNFSDSQSAAGPENLNSRSAAGSENLNSRSAAGSENLNSRSATGTESSNSSAVRQAISNRSSKREFHGKVLGIGGELKNTFCLGINNIFYPSAYVGDLADVRTVSALKSGLERTEKLLEMEPEIVACDLHPKYNSTLVAEEVSREKGIPLVRVQHHYAHVLSCMAENDYFGDILGVSFDGTGLGTDETIWGGEILLSNLNGFKRLASIAPFLQIGGDISSKEGWRIAVSMINSLFKDDAVDIAVKLGLTDENNAKVQRTLFERQINSVVSTSAGRLFDAVSAVLGIRMKSTFEGEASTALEFAVERCLKDGVPAPIENIEQYCINVIKYTFSDDTGKSPYDDKKNGNSFAAENAAGRNSMRTDLLFNGIMEEKVLDRNILRTDLLFRDIVNAKLLGASVQELAYYFHKALAGMIVSETYELSEETGVKTAALTGGVFQNKLLLRMTEEGLKKRGIKVLRHRMIPPNDGGIALGQAVYAAAKLNS